MIVLGDVPVIPVRCERCARVRTGKDWEDHPAKLPGELLGICATCADLLRRLAAQKYAREGRTLMRRRAKGYGPGTGDPFTGMRGNR